MLANRQVMGSESSTGSLFGPMRDGPQPLVERPQRRPYVTRVGSTIKGDAPWSVELSPKTLLVGRNSSGKSRITQAIELALSGAVSDVVGRSLVKDVSALRSLVPAGVECAARVEISDGRTAEWSSGGGRTASRTRHSGLVGIDADRVLPVRAVMSAVLGSEKTATKDFLALCGGDIDRAAVLGALPGEMHADYASAASRQRGHDEVATLLAVLADAEARARDGTTWARAQAEMVESIGRSVTGSRPTAEAITSAQAAADSARERVVSAEIALRRARDAGTQRADAARLSEIDAQLAAFPSVPERVDQHTRDRVGRLLATVQDTLAVGGDICPICDSALLSGALHARQQEIMDFLVDTKPLNSSAEERQRLLKDRAHLVARLQVAGSRDVNIVNISALEAEVATARAFWSEASAAHAALCEQSTRWNALAGTRAEIARVEGEISQARFLATSCQDAVRVLLDGAAERFRATVQSYLPSTWRFGLQLRDGDRPVFRFGLLSGVGTEDGSESGTAAPARLRTALAGAEWATVIAAMAAGVSGDGLSVVIPEDRAWDAGTLSAVMGGFSNFAGQVILCSTVQPEMPISGWTVVECRDDGMMG